MPVSDDLVVYLCVCIRSDCHAAAFGPFYTYEAAQDECNIRCDYAHVVSKTTFGKLDQIWMHQGGTNVDRTLHMEWWDRFAEKLAAEMLERERSEKVIGAGGYDRSTTETWQRFEEAVERGY